MRTTTGLVDSKRYKKRRIVQEIQMKNRIRSLMLAVTILLASCAALAQAQARMEFTVSMPEPNNHLYHVEYRCEGIKADTVDFKMPAWTPGYYRILNFAENVKDFAAQDGQEQSLAGEKAGANTWRVKSGRADCIILSYDVEATTRAV